MTDRRSALQVESCRTRLAPARRRFENVLGSGEIQRCQALPPFRPTWCAAIPNAGEPSSQSSPFLQAFPGSNQLELRLVTATLQERQLRHTALAPQHSGGSYCPKAIRGSRPNRRTSLGCESRLWGVNQNDVEPKFRIRLPPAGSLQTFGS